jgi:hypothetical protein
MTTREDLAVHLLTGEMVAAGLVTLEEDTIMLDDMGGRFKLEVRAFEVTGHLEESGS